MLAAIRRTYLSPWVLVSGIVHVIIVFTLGTAGFGVMAGGGIDDGDGFGGESIEVEIAGPNDGPLHGARAPTSPRVPSQDQAPAPEPPAEMEPDPVVDGQLDVALPEPPPEPPPTPREPTEAEPREEPPRPEATPQNLATRGEAPQPTEDLDSPESTEAAAPGETEDPSGTGGTETLAGPPAGAARDLILGSAGGMGSRTSPRQALLPNGGVCQDPAAGVWRAQKYRPTDRTWVRFILRVRREGDGLSGTITSRIWTGRPSNPNPGSATCTAFGMDHTWRMRARGTVQGDTMSFQAAGGAQLIRQDCPRRESLYAPDRFRGTLHSERDLFESINNDGAFDVNEPYTFRRVSCE